MNNPTKRGRTPRQTPEKVAEVQEYVARITLISKWSQTDLAHVLEITPQTVTNWMAGRRVPNSFRMVQLKHLATRVENSVRKRDKATRRAAREVSNAQII
jgi:DNA-binding transcriptional regulator YiaG